MGSVDEKELIPHADLCHSVNEIEVLDGAAYNEHGKMILVIYENGVPECSFALDAVLFKTLHEDISIMFDRRKNHGASFVN